LQTTLPASPPKKIRHPERSALQIDRETDGLSAQSKSLSRA
jgi:hypothetical protein